MKNVLYYFFLLVFSGKLTGQVIKPVENGLEILYETQRLKIEIWDANIIRVVSTPSLFSNRQSLSVIAKPNNKISWTWKKTDSIITIKTSVVEVSVLPGGKVSFTAKDKTILSEQGRSFKAITIQGENIFNIEQKFNLNKNEALYGLGQFANGAYNYRGKNVALIQENTDAVNPFLVSTQGYGILWDNYSLTEFRNNKAIDTASFVSEVADQIDYYFVYGPAMDSVISGYRKLTGSAPMYGKWAYGLWQCKDQYQSQGEILNVVKQYRDRHIPLDNIVQDWEYWNPLPWGSHYINRERYPNTKALTEELHKKYNTHIMFSVWPGFKPGSDNYTEFAAQKLFIGSGYDYDAYNPLARKIYWKQIKDSLYKKGIDAWWLDSTEPLAGLPVDERKDKLNNFLGTGARYLNPYALMTSKAVYEGQRKETNNKRVFILTRSSFAGLQHYGAAAWSGDISATWEVFQKQVPAGLNFCYSGIPYWTTDIGGYFIAEYPDNTSNPGYMELYTRWFQWGAFCPLFRIHGAVVDKEIWRFGKKGDWMFDALYKADVLRYRLMPYIYSQAWKVTNQGSTIMRGLAFDFPNDTAVNNISNQFMFGPSILVCPVTQPLYFKDAPMRKKGTRIPAANLFTSKGEQGGLTGEYFNDKNLTELKLTRKDSVIDFIWEGASPVAEINPDKVSIRWSGEVLTNKAGNYTFVTYADDGVKLWINGQLLINDWNRHGPEYRNGSIVLKENTKYTIKLEFLEEVGGANITLGWEFSDAKKEEKVITAALPDFVGEQKVYLPNTKGWFNFWDGDYNEGGKFMNTPVAIGHIPLFVKAGSILPVGPAIEYAAQKKGDIIELRIYAGADAEFTLYEDENDNYNYEKGLFSTITINWNEAGKTLTIGNRKGSFSGMSGGKIFNIIWVKKNHGVGENQTVKPDAVLRYNGKAIKIIKAK
jgi:alpha-D-xyloside xylohydrolase